ncbi:MAG: hypothetical protein DRJ21_01780 [Candidatus Methanomethylicota archaeon]|uniref:Uncharacterized protein n=1 Tax=Thermoproteota archaeon TaxID=2056631 RepID=A0A497ESY3_9CREN|nr:MAG: hypothetical protein DRJ21_01780 [Candidatus Verstraetearchaeota archaeon]
MPKIQGAKGQLRITHAQNTIKASKGGSTPGVTPPILKPRTQRPRKKKQNPTIPKKRMNFSALGLRNSLSLAVIILKI